MDRKQENSRESLLGRLSLPDAIRRCGELKIPVEEIAVLLGDRPGAGTLAADLSTPGTDAFAAWRRRQAINRKLDELF
jgi:hypothetical protein